MQLAVASALAGRRSDEIEFCEWDLRRGVFTPVSASAVLATAQQSRLDVVVRSPQATGRWSSGMQHARLSAHHAKRAVRDVVRSARERSHGAPAGSTNEGASAAWTPDTTYCNLGASWRHAGVEPLARRGSRSFRVALTVHDLIPVLAPQYTDLQLDEHFCEILDVADVILVPSRATEHDLSAFAERHGRRLPEVRHLPLGSELADQVPCVPTSLAGAAPAAGSFVLCAGSVEVRKNQHLLLDVWEMLVADHPRAEIPQLVVAGTAGQLSDETVSRLTRTASLRGVVTYVASPTTPELAWLFRNCAFTVFPSRYEGWGLPVAESLDVGKLCLTAGGSSLPEVGEGLTEMLDPFDREQWRGRILHFWTDRAEVAERERTIAETHRRVSVDDMARAVLALCS